ncbi:MAG TPA: gluconate 2-dehydrogenase subunit 3 family protein [Candidatus Didemnitutus sp.]|nr:gluconate 2-dehydrogenase subunit 3 family protein [Candidatus Didemnitutus sp.]
MNPVPPSLLTRREAIARLSVLLAGSIVGAEMFLQGTRVEGKESTAGFSADQLALMDEIGETIIPATQTPGAKAVGIGAFMAMMVTDCYDDAHHAAFVDGLAKVDHAAQAQHGRGFVSCSSAEKTALLEVFNREAAQTHVPRGTTPHFFRLMKELTLIGFFTSEIGCTQVLRYEEVPGSFAGDVPYHPGDRAWFNRARATMS